MRTFTNQAKKDIPDGFTEESWIRMYAAWGRFVDLSSRIIPWDSFLDYGEPETEVIGEDEGGNLICQTTIKLRFLQAKPDEPAPSVPQA